MLINTLKTLQQVEEIDTILVVSRDPSALSLARDFNARTVLEDGSPELNTALRRAAMVAQAYQVQEILVLPADLPLVKPEHLKEFLDHSGEPPEIVIAPDRRSNGTNALFINPAGLIEFCYGPGSLTLISRMQKKQMPASKLWSHLFWVLTLIFQKTSST